MPQLFSLCRNGFPGFFARHLLVAGFVFFPLVAGAAGLGSIRVRSALGERFEAVVSVSSADETLSSACFQLVDPAGGDGLKALRRAQLEFQRSGQGGEVRIRGIEPESEPVLRLALRLRCPEGTTSGIVREYSVLLDPPEYRKMARPVTPAVSPVTSVHSASRAASVWQVRSGETLERLARRYYPRDPAGREQFIAGLRELNADLPQDRNAKLADGLFLALPPVSKVADTAHRHAADTRVAKEKSAKRKSSQTALPPAKDSPYRLQIASAPQAMTSNAGSLSEADKLKQREHQLQQETDDQTAQLLQLKNRIAQLEKQIAEMSQAASAASSVAAPAVKVSSPALSAEPESGGIVYWLLAAAGAVLAGVVGVLAWRRYQYRQEILPSAEESFSFEPEIVTWATPGAEASSLKSASPAMPSFTDEKIAPQEVHSANSGSGSEGWETAAEINVVQPETVAQEVSLLMEYGMVHEAIEILRQEIKNRPQAVVLWMKLFEGCALQGDRQLFAEYAEAFRGRFLSEAWWGQVQGIGLQLDPDNPLYGEAGATGGAQSLASQPLAPESRPEVAPELSPGVKEASPAQPEAMLEFPLEFQLPDSGSASPGEAESAGQNFAPLFGTEEPSVLDLPPLDLPVSGAVSEADFVSDDPTMQAISRLAMAGERDEACHQLEELLYRGSFEQQLLAAKWLDKLLQIK